MSFSIEPVGASVSSSAQARKPMSARASTTAGKSIEPLPMKPGLSLRCISQIRSPPSHPISSTTLKPALVELPTS